MTVQQRGPIQHREPSTPNTHRPTIEGLHLQSCLIEVLLLDGGWNSGTAAAADVHRVVPQCFFQKRTTVVAISESVVLNEVVMCVVVGRAFFEFDTLSNEWCNVA